MLILVRHAMPILSQSEPPHAWCLSAEGSVAAARLAMPPNAYLAASDEPKAFQTLEPFGAVSRDARFGEVRRPEEHWETYREARSSYLEGVDHGGWEPRDEVVARFDAAVMDHSVRRYGRTVVVATHGMAMTLWLAAKVGLHSPVTFWDDLRLPDMFAVGLAARMVTRIEYL